MVSSTKKIYLIALMISLLIHLVAFIDFQTKKINSRTNAKLQFKNSEILVKLKAIEPILENQKITNPAPQTPSTDQSTDQLIESGFVKSASVIGAITPKYPQSSRLLGEQGDVTISVIVGKDGLVVNSQILTSSGSTKLDLAALEAVKNAKFTPAMEGSVAIASETEITISFRLNH